MWVSFQMAINVVMTILFGFVYFSIFTAHFIGSIRNTVGFFILYGIHIATTLGAIIAGFFLNIELILPQIHFILICLIGTTILPFNLYNRHKRENLEGQLEVAKEQISELKIVAERQRIARDLHDTLGQKLSLIGLKSDLALKLLEQDPKRAENELQDIRKTASTALNEVRDLVANIRSVKLTDELVRGKQILHAANIHLTVSGKIPFTDISPITENILSMCMKEAITNVVKHSEAKNCRLTFLQKPDAYTVVVKDDGIGIHDERKMRGSGLAGMRERLEFVNGTLLITSYEGTTLTISIPVIKRQLSEGS